VGGSGGDPRADPAAQEAEVVTHWLQVRDKPGLLCRLMKEFVGGRLSLEGDLSECAFLENMVLARDEVGVLRRNTLAPRQDFVVLRLEPGTIAPILKEVMAAGLTRAIIHVQIEYAGVLQLGAYDNFHPECVVAGSGVSAGLLVELQSSGVLRAFRVANAGP
jgi:hypothetical protein